MLITIELPEEIEKQLESAWGDLSRRTLEALAVEGYRSVDLSAGQVLRLSVWEAEQFLKTREASLPYSSEDLRRDMETQERILSGLSPSPMPRSN